MSLSERPSEPPAVPKRTEAGKTPGQEAEKTRRRVTKVFPNLTPRPRSDSTPASSAPSVGDVSESFPRKWRRPRRKARVTPPSQAELDALSPKERQELYDGLRQRRHQTITTISVLFGVIFAAGGLLFTGKTWETGQKTLETTQFGQITDRYTKAVEQLGSKTVEVRLGAIYALGRIAADSPGDAVTIQNVLAAFVRNRDLCHAKKGRCSESALGKPRNIAPVWPETDVRAALDLAVSLTSSTDRSADFSNSRLPGMVLPKASLAKANMRNTVLAGAYLLGVDLSRSDLTTADLRGAVLSGADFRGATVKGVWLDGADLSVANLVGVNIQTDLVGVYMKGVRMDDAVMAGFALDNVDMANADLRGVDLTGARLTNVNLSRADLSGAKLRGVDLTGMRLRGAKLVEADLAGTGLFAADLRGADLRGVHGLTIAQIRASAITDRSTKF